MNLRQLRYFVAIVDSENMTRAAEILHVAQPALSQQITALEERLGVQLLIRSTRGTTATSQGRLLYRHAKTILRQVENTRALLSKTDTNISGNVSVGMASSTARVTALPLMKAVKAKHPGIVLEIVDVPSANLASLVMHGRVDFSLVPDPSKPKGMKLTPILREELFWMAHPGINVSSPQVSLEQIASLPMVLPSMPNTLRARVEHAFLRKSLSYNLYGEASTSAILIPAVKAGMASTILPYSAAHEEINSNQVTVHKIESGFFRDMYLCTSDTQPLSAATDAVNTIYYQVIKKLINKGIMQGCELL